MPDIADISAPSIEIHKDAAVAMVLNRPFEAGQPGECNLCGYEFSRLVIRNYHDEDVEVCGACRDKYRLG